MSRQSIILEKFNELVADANAMFNIQLPHIEVKFNLRGRSAGQAIAKRKFGSFTTEYSVRFNRDMIEGSGFEHILEETVAHELAHIVCYVTGKDNGHGKVWKAVCIALGGSGARCHREEVTPARITEQFLYNTTCGKVVKVGKIRHNRIQNDGKVYRLNNGGSIIPNSWRFA